MATPVSTFPVNVDTLRAGAAPFVFDGQPYLSLTTPFVQPPECQNRWVQPNGDEPITLFSTLRPDSTTYPWDSSYTACQASSAIPIYYPGVCYSGYTLGFITQFELQRGDGVTTAWGGDCCKSGWTHTFYTLDDSRLEAYCSSSFTEEFPVLRAIFTSGEDLTYYKSELVTFADGSSSWETSSSTSFYTEGTALANPIWVGWRQEDLALFPSDYGSSLAGIISVTVPPAAPTGAPTGTNGGETNGLPSQTGGPPPSNDSLGTGAIAGIAVGAVIGGALIAGFLVFFLMQRRRKKKNPYDTPATAAQSGQHNDTAEMEDTDQEHGERKWFLGGKWRHESGTEHPTPELNSRDVRVVPGPPAELEGNTRYSMDEFVPVRDR